MYVAMLGEPNARRSRTSQSIESLIPVVEGELLLNRTASAPCAALISFRRSAVMPSASSQESSSQPGSAAPLGFVRRSGMVSRSG